MPRSLADDLRDRDDAALAALLRARPDLVSPVPADMTALATRATTRASVGRALDRLDLFALQTVDVVCALPEPTSAAAVTALLGADATEPLARLRELALLWGPDDELRPVRPVRDIVGNPAGLGPPAEVALGAYGPARLATLLRDLELPPTGDVVEAARRIAAALADAATVQRLLSGADPAVHAALAQLTWGPPAGAVDAADRDVSAATARTPLEWLLARGLLVATSTSTVVLPREVAIVLRGGRVHADPAPSAPGLDVSSRSATLVDRTAAGAAFALVRQVEDVLETWALDGPPVLRSGGLGVRELRRTASALDLDEAQLAFVLEAAYAAGLLGPSGDLDEVWLPTPAYDAWLAWPTAQRWSALAEAWLGTTRVRGLVGTRGERDKLVSALGPDLDRAAAPEMRRGLLEELAAVPAGSVAGVESLRERLRWLRPRRGGRLRDDLVTWTLEESEWVGTTGLGALSPFGRLLLQGDPEAAEEALTPLLPQPLDKVLLQADLTAVAPGPLTSELAHSLALMADVESRGGATVYRFTESSVRRALDAGRSASELQALLERHSSTSVPQPLQYLVEDVSRRHGRIRVGTLSSYVRCDDEALLAEILADRRAAQLRLRRLAPTVLASQSPLDAVLDRLREIGYAPAAEAPDGDIVVRRPDSRRTPPRQRPPRLGGEPPAPNQTLLGAAVRALRAGDRASTAVRRPSSPGSAQAPSGLRSLGSSATLQLLRAAAAESAPLWIGYVNADGGASQRVIEPISVEGGYVRAFDHVHDEVRTFALHRITGVAQLD
jgi:hypothetical protein